MLRGVAVHAVLIQEEYGTLGWRASDTVQQCQAQTSLLCYQLRGKNTFVM